MGFKSREVSTSDFILGESSIIYKRRNEITHPFLEEHLPIPSLWCLTACGIVVPRPEVRTELLWWELRVQTAGLTENLRLQGTSVGVRPPRGPHLSTKTQLYPTACKLQCWTAQAKQPVKQEYSTTHQKKKQKKLK